MGSVAQPKWTTGSIDAKKIMPMQFQSSSKPAANPTGIPNQLKSGLEQLSGFDLSGVRVHYNSAKPAQLSALAYSQDQDIHLSPGQERHLPHEGWHVVQQMQGRVKPTMQSKGVAINDDKGLENEADVMGAKALGRQSFAENIREPMERAFGEDFSLEDVADVASEGASGSGHTLPNFHVVQRSFGKHNISNIRAHTDTAATESMTVLGKGPYATGQNVVLGQSTDLYTVAHEAAHVIQQRSSLQLKDNVGQSNDPHEQHANAVANQVVRGKSAEGLLDQYVDSSGSQGVSQTPVVQCRLGTIRQNLINSNPQRATNAAYLQILQLLQQGATIQAAGGPSVAQCDQMLELIKQIRVLLQTAVSTKWFSKGAARNAALDAMRVSLNSEEYQITLARVTARNAAEIVINTDPHGYAGPLPGLGAQAMNLSPTGVQQGASGSYFDRGPAIGAAPGPLRGIFKPESQEGGARGGRDKRGAGAIREVLGDTLDQSLGLGVVPRTRLIAINSTTLMQGVDRRIPWSGDSLQVGSYQQAVPNVSGDITSYLGNAAAYQAFDTNSLQRIAILDMISLNKDRHGGNILFNAANQLSAIDQGEMAPSAKGFSDKFRGMTDASGWAWADLPESEQAWSVANLAIITNMDPEAEIDNLAQQAQTQSTSMATLTGQAAQDTHLSAQSIAMMKYAARTLKMCAAAGLTPAQTETIYTKRGQSRVARLDATNTHVKKTAKSAGGGEFSDFISATFLNDSIDAQLAQANGQPAPAERFTYGSGVCESEWSQAMIRGLGRVAEQDPTKRAGIGRVLGNLLLPPVMGTPLAPITAASTTAEARRLWAHMRVPATVVGNRFDEKVVMDAIWEHGSIATRTRIIAVLDVQTDQLRMSHLGYILEAVDPAHRMNLPSKLVNWFEASSATDFWVWLSQPANAPAAGPTADYLTVPGRAAVQVIFAGGQLQQGAPPAPMNTSGGDGWTVVLSGGQFYSQPKSGPSAMLKTQHSSFMAGLPVDAAAMMRVNAGTLEFLNNYSGHYAPTIANMAKMILAFMANGVPMTGVQIEDKNGLGRALGRLDQFNAIEYLKLARDRVRS
jgi:hypothetical protein